MVRRIHHLAKHVAAQSSEEMSRRARLGGQAKGARYASGELQYKTCSICDRHSYAYGLCKLHHRRKKADARRRGVLYEQGDPEARGPRQRNNPCKVKGCGDVAQRYGWCLAHWQEEKIKRRKISRPYGAAQKFVAELFSKETDKCIWWPFGPRARIRVNRKTRHVPRLICEHLYGSAPTSAHQASHTCNHGHLGCVNPKHLVWETPLQQRERIRKRVSTNDTSKIHKLSAATLRLILRQEGKRSPIEIADIFEVDEDTVLAVFDSA